MGTNTTIGTQLLMSANPPLTRDQAGYEGVTFTTIGRIISISDIPLKWTTDMVNILATGGSDTHKSYHEPVILTGLIEVDRTDPGQILALQAYEAINGSYTFQIDLSSGNSMYFTGKMTEYTFQGLDGKIEKRSFSIAVDAPDSGSGILEVTPT